MRFIPRLQASDSSQCLAGKCGSSESTASRDVGFGFCRGTPGNELLAGRPEADLVGPGSAVPDVAGPLPGRELAGEEGHDVLFDAAGDAVDVIAGVDGKAMLDPVIGEQAAVFLGASQQPVGIAAIEGDAPELLQVRDVLIEHRHRGIRRPAGENGGLGFAILRGQVEIERRILRVGSPSG